MMRSTLASPTAPSTPALVVELSQLEYAMRARTSRDAWGSAAAADRNFASLLQRREAILAALRHRGVDFTDEHRPPSRRRTDPVDPEHLDEHETSPASPAVSHPPAEPTPTADRTGQLGAEPSVDSTPDLTGDVTVDLAGKVETLERALVTRSVIGQAMGILMERHKVTAEEAFRVLRTASSVTNRKLHDIAADLVDTGELPGPHPQPPKLPGQGTQHPGPDGHPQSGAPTGGYRSDSVRST